MDNEIRRDVSDAAWPGTMSDDVIWELTEGGEEVDPTLFVDFVASDALVAPVPPRRKSWWRRLMGWRSCILRT